MDDLKYVENQTEEICMIAVRQNIKSFLYVKEQTDTICEYVLKKDPWYIKHIKNQKYHLCKLAVETNPCVICHVENQTDELCKLAVNSYGCVINFIKNKTEELCKLAIKRSCDAIFHIPIDLITCSLYKYALENKSMRLDVNKIIQSDCDKFFIQLNSIIETKLKTGSYDITKIIFSYLDYKNELRKMLAHYYVWHD
uniref:DUF4116 domain-containing protein n=1 Tax=viral metagenome TaxID=1070528 RepID=A0A6C0EBP8_9ZZZZ